MLFPRPISLVFPLLAFCVLPVITFGQDQAKLAFFETKIRPVLVKHCYRCHSEKSGKSKGSLRVDSKAALAAGGDSGPAIVPGKPNESVLLLAINHSGEAAEMPPDSRLSDKIAADFEKWIRDGAIDPRKGKTTVAKTSIDIEKGREFWAFQPRQTFDDNTTIDSLVNPQSPTATADKLIRRLFIDLIGLPPTIGERARFIKSYNDESPQLAVEKTVDQLLSRKEFGEKWARHWLDVARYADSNGGDFNLTFHESWRYRNFVIDAFNNDMPYDQFLREQIAGDLLEHDSIEQRNRQLIATGFLMVAPKMLTERNKAKMHLDIADEQLNTIGRATMGLTLGCARCHDHKFDPIPTRDYYAMAGILHSTRTADRVLMNNVNVTGWTNTNLMMDEETRKKLAVSRSKQKELESKIATAKKNLDAASKNIRSITVDDNNAKKSGPWRKSTYRPNRIGDNYLAIDTGKGPYSIEWQAKLPKPGKYEVRVSFGGGSGLCKKAPYKILHAGDETKLTIDQTKKPNIGGVWFSLGQYEFAESATVILAGKSANGGAIIADAIQWIHVDDLTKDDNSTVKLRGQLKKLQTQLTKLKSNQPTASQAMAAQDNSAKRLGDLHIRIRGETTNLGKKVARGFLQVATYNGESTPQISDKQSGRVELANWLTHPNHPLTARVMSNRIWQQLFGIGIVATSDNFGVRGAKPTHLKLLDHLANEFVNDNWSMKSLIRKIVLSRTYQQTASTPSKNDPDNTKLHHQNRRPASAETIRDSILAIAEKLDRESKQSTVTQLGMYAIETSGKRHASLAQTDKLLHRSIYMPIVRGAVPPSLSVFDFPNPDLVTGNRSETTVPSQALFMLNSPFVLEMAAEVSKSFEPAESTHSIVQKLYKRILIRESNSQETTSAKSYIGELTSAGKSKQQAVASFTQILFSSTEFRFIE